MASTPNKTNLENVLEKVIDKVTDIMDLEDQIVETPAEPERPVIKEADLDVDDAPIPLPSQHFPVFAPKGLDIDAPNQVVLDIGDYAPNLRLTDQEKAFIGKSMTRMATGLNATVPISCNGERCPFVTNCPLAQIKKLPIGCACPIESSLMDQYTREYIKEYNVDINSITERMTMTQLAAIHIIEMRATWAMSRKGHDTLGPGLYEQAISVDNEGVEILQLQEHPAWNILDRAWKYREKILTSLVGTRREKYKKASALKETSNIDTATRAAELKRMVQGLANKIENIGIETVESTKVEDKVNPALP